MGSGAKVVVARRSGRFGEGSDVLFATDQETYLSP
jgi:hypothetical protein